MKKLSIVALVLVLAMVFTGCTKNELNLYNAFNKMQNVNSMESDTNVSFTLKGEGLSPEYEEILKEVASTLNNSKINIHQKVVQNKDKTAAKAEANMNLDIAGIKTDMQLWVDTDMSGDELKLVEIIKMPQMLMASMPEEYRNKEYMVVDFKNMAAMNEEAEEEINFNELMKVSKELQPKMADFFKEYQKDFKPGIEVVKYKGTRTVDGEKLSIYELKLNDKTFKDLIKYTVNYNLDNKDVAKFIKEYITIVRSGVQIPKEEKQSAQQKLKKELADLDKELPELKKEFNEFMDEIKDIKILGEKGIAIEYGVNNDGYVVHQAGTVDLRIDLENMAKIADDNIPSVKGVLNLGIKFNTKVHNINKDTKINMPKVDKNNALFYDEMMKDLMTEEVEKVEIED